LVSTLPNPLQQWQGSADELSKCTILGDCPSSHDQKMHRERKARVIDERGVKSDQCVEGKP
jgi:hypothetical protein